MINAASQQTLVFKLCSCAVKLIKVFLSFAFVWSICTRFLKPQFIRAGMS